MVSKKAKSTEPVTWKANDERYPRKRGTCELCGTHDDLKLAYDEHRYICMNDSACLLRWRKQLADRKPKN